MYKAWYIYRHVQHGFLHNCHSVCEMVLLPCKLNVLCHIAYPATLLSCALLSFLITVLVESGTCTAISLKLCQSDGEQDESGSGNNSSMS